MMPRVPQPVLPLVVEWAKQREGQEFHYLDAAEVVRKQTGRSDSNLAKIVLRGISRSELFERTGRGMYRLRSR